MARAAYCRARLLNMADSPSYALEMLHKGLGNQDSSRYPYTRHRMRLLESIINLRENRNFSESYLSLENAVKYFSKIHDTLALAETYHALAITLWEIGEDRSACEYIEKAQYLYDHSGVRMYALKNRLNLARAFLCLGDSAKCGKILQSLREDSIAKGDHRFYNSVLVDSYIFWNDTAILEEGYRDAYLNNAASKERIILFEKLMADRKHEEGNLSMADYHSSIAVNESRNLGDLKMLKQVYELHSRILHSLGNTDSAYHYLRKKDSISNLILKNDKRHALINELMRSEINTIKEDMKLRSRYEKNKFLLILLICVIIVLCLTIILGRRLNRLKLKDYKKTLEIEQRAKQLANASFALKDKEIMLEGVRKIIDNANQDATVPLEKTLRELDSSLKLHFEISEEWDNLKMLYDSLPIGFEEVIRKQAPGISPSLLQLSAYIACGLTNKQIARLLRIQPDSVKKSRWRLRTQLGLSSEESLDTYLIDLKNKLIKNLHDS